MTGYCAICETFIGQPDYFIAMCNGVVVNSEETDDWAGFAVCENCYDSKSLELLKNENEVNR